MQIKYQSITDLTYCISLLDITYIFVQDHLRPVGPYYTEEQRERRGVSRDRHEQHPEEEEGALFFTDCVLYPPKLHGMYMSCFNICI